MRRAQLKRRARVHVAASAARVLPERCGCGSADMPLGHYQSGGCLACGFTTVQSTQRQVDAVIARHDASECRVLRAVRSQPVPNGVHTNAFIANCGPLLTELLAEAPAKEKLKAYLDSIGQISFHTRKGLITSTTLVQCNGEGHLMLPLVDLDTFLKIGGKSAYARVPESGLVWGPDDEEVEDWLINLVDDQHISESLGIAHYEACMRQPTKRPVFSGLALIWARGPLDRQFWHIDALYTQIIVPLYEGARSTLVYGGMVCRSSRCISPSMLTPVG